VAGRSYGYLRGVRGILGVSRKFVGRINYWGANLCVAHASTSAYLSTGLPGMRAGKHWKVTRLITPRLTG